MPLTFGKKALNGPYKGQMRLRASFLAFALWDTVFISKNVVRVLPKSMLTGRPLLGHLVVKPPGTCTKKIHCYETFVVRIAQCGNLRIFTSIGFYVKSMLVIWERQNLASLIISKELNFDFGKFLDFLNDGNLKKEKIRAFEIFKMEVLYRSEIAEINSCKIKA